MSVDLAGPPPRMCRHAFHSDVGILGCSVPRIRARKVNRLCPFAVCVALVGTAGIQQDIEAAAREEAAAAERAHRALEASLRDLTIGVRLKEELIRTLAHNSSEAEAAAAKYSARVQSLQTEVDALKQALVEQVPCRTPLLPETVVYCHALYFVRCSVCVRFTL